MARKRILSAPTLAAAVEHARAVRAACIQVQTEAPIGQEPYLAAQALGQAATRLIMAATGESGERQTASTLPAYHPASTKGR